MDAYEDSEEEFHDAIEPLEEHEPVEQKSVPKSIIDANAAKEEGNTLFRARDFVNAAAKYSVAIELCPTEEEHNEALATFHCNRAACHLSLEDFELAAEDCTKALDRNPIYIKAIMRRCQAQEALTNYDEALLDAKRCLELDPTNAVAAEAVPRLTRLAEEKMNKMKDEALGKLKELGNTILGNFGMSMDNFKMVQDPVTGSWSVSMNNGK